MRSALDHAQGVAPVASGLRAQFVHEGAHQENPPASDAQFAWLKARDSVDVEGRALVMEQDFHRFGCDDTLDLHRGVG
jgi:hypothetical protein